MVAPQCDAVPSDNPGTKVGPPHYHEILEYWVGRIGRDK